MFAFGVDNHFEFTFNGGGPAQTVWDSTTPNTETYHILDYSTKCGDMVDIADTTHRRK